MSSGLKMLPAEGTLDDQYRLVSSFKAAGVPLWVHPNTGDIAYYESCEEADKLIAKWRQEVWDDFVP